MKKIIRMFEEGNVCVVGERGTGKDMLIANVVARRKLPYISNVEYSRKQKIKAEWYPLDFEKIDCGKNTYRNFMTGDIQEYVYPYPTGIDVYISDVGVYMPSQYCNELNREYKHVPTFMALSRQIGECNVHINVQNLNRAWDKLREQSRRYITCLKCHVVKIGKKQLIIQRVRIYEMANSCISNIPSLKLPLSMRIGKDKALARLYALNYKIQHGEIEEKTLIYWNKSEYDTNVFKAMLKGGKKHESEESDSNMREHFNLVRDISNTSLR